MQRGFTLVETLVAVLLLVTAVAGPLTIASRSLVAATVAKDQVVAFYLAQDAIEYIRFARDTNKLQKGDWLTGAGALDGINLNNCLDINGCYVDTTTANDPAVCPASGCPVLKYASTQFSYTSGSDSIYRRTIQLGSVASNELEITVTVSWSSTAGTTRSITVYENIFNWQ